MCRFQIQVPPWLGIALCDAKQWQEALYYMDQASLRTMFEAVVSTLNLARVYQSISWVQYGEHRFPDVLDAIERHGSMLN